MSNLITRLFNHLITCVIYSLSFPLNYFTIFIKIFKFQNFNCVQFHIFFFSFNSYFLFILPLHFYYVILFYSHFFSKYQIFFTFFSIFSHFHFQFLNTSFSFFFFFLSKYQPSFY